MMADQKTVQIDDVILEPGTSIQGRYTLGDPLGAGGFAKVFEAFDETIERPVAIKFLDLHRSLDDPEAAEAVVTRFEREAKLAARIEHPNVVNIYDYGLLGARQSVPFIVMERLSGHDLERELDENGSMPPTRALPLFVSCLDALGKAHREGIVHKDIKPSNLFVSNPQQRDEALRLVDFGIAHIKSVADARLTQTGQVLGTPQYFAPEYINNQRVGPALDVYQMGLVLVEMLSGRPVVDLDNALLCMHRHSQGDLEVPAPLLDGPLGPIVAKALALDDAQRFADAYAFADALRDVDPTTVPVVTPDAPMHLLAAADFDSNDQFSPNRTPNAERPTLLATTNAPHPHHAKTASLPHTASTPAPEQARRKAAGLYVILGVLAFLVLGAGTGVAALIAAGIDHTAPADESRPAANLEPSASPEHSDKTHRERAEEDNERSKEERKKAMKRQKKERREREKRRKRLEKKLEREGFKRIEKAIDKLSDF